MRAPSGLQPAIYTGITIIRQANVLVLASARARCYLAFIYDNMNIKLAHKVMNVKYDLECRLKKARFGFTYSARA